LVSDPTFPANSPTHIGAFLVMLSCPRSAYRSMPAV
jgi:hypothetical protein